MFKTISRWKAAFESRCTNLNGMYTCFQEITVTHNDGRVQIETVYSTGTRAVGICLTAEDALALIEAVKATLEVR